MRDETTRELNKQEVTKPQIFFSENSSLYPCDLFTVSLPFFFCYKPSGDFSYLRKERFKTANPKLPLTSSWSTALKPNRYTPLSGSKAAVATLLLINETMNV